MWRCDGGGAVLGVLDVDLKQPSPCGSSVGAELREYYGTLLFFLLFFVFSLQSAAFMLRMWT